MIVYIVSRKPTGRTRNQYVPPLIAPSAKPELLIRSVKTKSALWWLSGTKTRIPMMISAPTTCHHTEMLLNSATTGGR